MFLDAVDDLGTLVGTGKCATLKSTQGDLLGGACRVASTISSLIGAAESGDCAAADELFSSLYKNCTAWRNGSWHDEELRQA